MALNKIVTPFLKLQYTPKNEKPRVTANLKSTVSILVQESATEIHMLPFDQNECTQLKTEINELPPSLKNRIKIADENLGLKKEVLKYLEPTKELNIAVSKGVTFDNPYLEMAMRIISYASKKECQADVPLLDNIDNQLKWSKQNCRNDEGQARLDNIIGLFNCYKPTTIDGIQLQFTDPQFAAISERLDELLAQPDLQELSKLKYTFGIPAKIRKLELLKTDFKLRCKKILQNENFRTMLSYSPMVASLVLSGGTFAIPFIPIPVWQKFNPPIFDLMNTKKKLLTQIKDLQFHVFLLGDVPLPSKVNAPNKNEFYLPGVFTSSTGGIGFRLNGNS